jgi:hypothetical protein
MNRRAQCGYDYRSVGVGGSCLLCHGVWDYLTIDRPVNCLHRGQPASPSPDTKSAGAAAFGGTAAA